MIDFDYVALNALAAVVREGSFDAAAKTLNVTQSAVSQRIKQLEERVGAILIVRGRPCVPTDFGLQLCRHVDHVLLLEHEIKKDMQADAGGTTKAAVLRIVVNNDSLATWFPSVVRRAQKEVNAHLEILSDDQGHSLDHLKSGEAFAALTSTEQNVQGFRRTALGDMEYVAIATNEFCKRELEGGVTLESLCQAPSILFDKKDQLPHQWLTRAFGETTDMNAVMMPSYEGYMACINNGAGWGMMPTVTAARQLRAGQLVELVPDTRINIPLYWHSTTQGAELFRKLASIVADEARKRLAP